MYVCGTYAGGMRTDGVGDEEEAVMDKQSGCEKSNRYISLAVHCIGLDRKKPYKRHGRYFYRPYRNYYDAGGKDVEIWDVMVGAGYAKAGKKNRFGGRMYWLTREGLDWLGEKLGIHIWDEEE